VNPLDDTPKTLRPLVKALWGMNCSCCDKPWSRWGSGPPKAKTLEPVCSICFLYKSNWGQKNRTLVNWSVEQAEATGVKIEKDEEGRLTSPLDGDRILSALCLHVRSMSLGMKPLRLGGN
jgi:hypothetical protein